jgi:hypothetical protein
MINCGGTVDLRRTYPLETDTYCYVIDSHRPYSHYNILPSSDQVIVLGDDFLKLEQDEIPGESDEEHMQSDSEDDDSDRGSESGDDDDEDRSDNGRENRCVTKLAPVTFLNTYIHT